MKNIFSVAQVNAYIKNLFVQDYVLNDIGVRGEISNCKKHSSGHIYFTLKDGAGAISCVLFSRYTSLLPCELEEGMGIVARGYVSVYERSGNYQLYVTQVQLDGVGALYERYEAMKKQLEQKGYFDSLHKKSLPKYPKAVGIVTSGTGAAIRDIINISKRRNPYIQLILYPTLVQGQQAARNIAEAIHYLDRLEDVEAIIVGRGGGSIEDLWAFNEEIVAQAIYEAKTPIISAVGHETDFTIADFVSDLRAPTPSAAAELAIPAIEAINNMLKQYQYKLELGLNRKLEMQKNQLQRLQLRLHHKSPIRLINDYQQNLIDIDRDLKRLVDQRIKEHTYGLQVLNEKLKALSPMSYIEKGYAFVSNSEGQVITHIGDVEEKEKLKLQLADGELLVEVLKKEKKRWDEDGETSKI